MTVGFPIIVVIAILAVVLLGRQRDPVKRARILKRAGFGVMAFITAFFGLFVVGETFTDPGGWQALGWVATWAVPLAALAAVAWYRPEWAARLFAVLTAAVIGVSVWFAVNPEGWRAFEDRHGPIRAIISFVLAAAVALLGLKRTAVAGVLLLVLGVVPVVVSSLGSQLGFASLAVVSSAPFIGGVLYLCSAAVAGGSAPSGGTHARPEGRPKARAA
ncbi:MAG TPA: hypothetical protein VFA45_16660 [Actinomycetes bacterium]|jgi:MFS family permease|nr:hypothetical protein [Actinomycetes bacterium]